MVCRAPLWLAQHISVDLSQRSEYQTYIWAKCATDPLVEYHISDRISCLFMGDLCAGSWVLEQKNKPDDRKC